MPTSSPARHTPIDGGAALRHRRGRCRAAERAARPGAAGGADAPARPRRAARPGAPARRGLDAARRDRVGRAAQRDLLRPARVSGKTTLARIAAAARAGRLRGGVGGQRRPCRGPRRDRARRGAPPGVGPADDLLPRRDPPLQQGPAGRAAAGGRGGAADADRGDDREPLLRGQLGAALALPDLRAPAARAGRRSRRCCAARSRDPERGIADPPEISDEALELLAARSGGDARVALAALERAVETARATGAARSTSPTAEDALQRKARRSTTARATATTTTSRPGSRRPAAPTSTPRSTTSR